MSTYKLHRNLTRFQKTVLIQDVKPVKKPVPTSLKVILALDLLAVTAFIAFLVWLKAIYI